MITDAVGIANYSYRNNPGVENPDTWSLVHGPVDLNPVPPSHVWHVFALSLMAMAICGNADDRSVTADFDSDGRIDRATIQTEPRSGVETVVVKFGNGNTSRIVADAATGGWNAITLSVRDSGDPQCPDWRPQKTCGRSFELYHGPALVVARHGERAVILHWETGTQFFMEFEHR